MFKKTKELRMLLLFLLLLVLKDKKKMNVKGAWGLVIFFFLTDFIDQRRSMNINYLLLKKKKNNDFHTFQTYLFVIIDAYTLFIDFYDQKTWDRQLFYYTYPIFKNVNNSCSQICQRLNLCWSKFNSTNI